MKKRSAYHHGNLRRAVMRATLALVEKGRADELSLRDVARRARVSHGAPYHHFADREALFAAIAEEGFALLATAMLGATAKSPRARFEAFGRAYVRFALEHPGHFRLMFRPELMNAKKHPGVVASSQAAMQVLVELVRACKTRKDPRDLALVGWTSAHGLAALLVDGPLLTGDTGLPHDPDALAQRVSRTVGALISKA